MAWSLRRGVPPLRMPMGRELVGSSPGCAPLPLQNLVTLFGDAVFIASIAFRQVAVILGSSPTHAKHDPGRVHVSRLAIAENLAAKYQETFHASRIGPYRTSSKEGWILEDESRDDESEPLDLVRDWLSGNEVLHPALLNL